MKGSGLSKIASKGLKFLCVSICLAGILGCQKQKEELTTTKISESKEIQRLKLKINRLEQILKESSRLPPNLKNKRIPPGKIKSLTFRIGTEDDRLRIYWEDGSKSDLPCMKEQFIWACG